MVGAKAQRCGIPSGLVVNIAGIAALFDRAIYVE
jgi:hypothetical protein